MDITPVGRGPRRPEWGTAERIVRAHEAALLAPGRLRPNEWRGSALARRVHADLKNLSATHPVAPVAQRLCEDTAHFVPLGGVACGVCWEEAIRADQRVVIEFELPLDQHEDPCCTSDDAAATSSSQVA